MAHAPWLEAGPGQAFMDCAGRAQRRRRFRIGRVVQERVAVPTKSVVASVLPPQSKSQPWCVCQGAPRAGGRLRFRLSDVRRLGSVATNLFGFPHTMGLSGCACIVSRRCRRFRLTTPTRTHARGNSHRALRLAGSFRRILIRSIMTSSALPPITPQRRSFNSPTLCNSSRVVSKKSP